MSRTLLDLAIGAFAIGWAAIFFRLAVGVDPITGSMLRLGLAFLVLLPVVLRARRAGALPPRVLRAAVLGGALYALHFGTWVASLELTSVAASVTLVTATPVLLAAVGVLRGRDRPSVRLALAIAVATIGVVVIGAGDFSLGPDALLGDGLALAGALAMAAYLLLARELGPDLDAFAFSGLAAGLGAVFLGITTLALALAGHGPELGSIPTSSWIWIAAAALVPQVIGHSLLTRALRDATPTRVGLATCAEPVLSTALAIPILGEVPGALVSLGCVVTLAGVLLGVAAKR